MGDTSEEKRALIEQQKNIRLVKATIEARRKELKEVYHLDEVKILDNKLADLKKRNKSLDRELDLVKKELGKQKGLLDEIKHAKSSVTGVETPNAPALDKHKQDLAEIRSETHMLKEKKRDLDREVEIKHKQTVDKQKHLRELKLKLKDKKKLGDKDTSALSGPVSEEDIERLRAHIELLVSEKKAGTEQFYSDLREIEEQKQILLEDKNILEAALAAKAKELRAVSIKSKEFLRVSRYRNHAIPQSVKDSESNQSTQTRLLTRKDAHERKLQTIREREEAERELIEAKLRALSTLYEKGSQNQDTLAKMREDILGNDAQLTDPKTSTGKNDEAKTANFAQSRIKYVRQSEETQPLNSVASERGSSIKAKTGTVNDPFDDMMHSQFDSKGDSKKVQSNQVNIKSSGMSFGPAGQKVPQISNKLGQQSKVLTNSTPPQAHIKDSNSSDPQTLKRDPLPLPKIMEANQSGHNSQANESRRSQAETSKPTPEANPRPKPPSTALNEAPSLFVSKPANPQPSTVESRPGPGQSTADASNALAKPSKPTLPPTLAQSEITAKPPARKATVEKDEPMIEFVPINQAPRHLPVAKPTTSMVEDINNSKPAGQVGAKSNPQSTILDSKKNAEQNNLAGKQAVNNTNNPQGSPKPPKEPETLGKPQKDPQTSEEFKVSNKSEAGHSKNDAPTAKAGTNSNPNNSKGASANDSDLVKRTTTLKPKKIQDETVYDGEDDDDLSQGTIIPVKPLLGQNDSFNMLAQNVRGMNISQLAGKSTSLKPTDNLSQAQDAQANKEPTKDLRAQNSAHGSRGKVTFNDNIGLAKGDQSGESRAGQQPALAKSTNLAGEKQPPADSKFIKPTVADSLEFSDPKNQKKEPVIDFLGGGAADKKTTLVPTNLGNSDSLGPKPEPKHTTTSKPPAAAPKPILSDEFLANPDAGGNGKPYSVDKPAPFKLSFKPKPPPEEF